MRIGIQDKFPRFIIVVGLSTIAYAALLWTQQQGGTLRGEFIWHTISFYLLAFAVYLTAVFWSERRKIPLKWIWYAAVFFRVLLLFTSPTLSDDIYRYLWDGHLATQGVSPYMYAIEAAELDAFEIPVRFMANNTWMATPYMPVAQTLFFLLAVLFPPLPIFTQIAMIIFDLLAAGLIMKLLQLAHLPKERVIYYLWNPLVIVEVAHGGHIDAWMVLLSLTAVWLALRPQKGINHWTLSPLFLAFATLTKVLPILLFPILFWRWSWRQRLFYGLATFTLLLPAGLRAGWGLEPELNGRGLFGALRIYAATWQFNSGTFHWIVSALNSLGFNNPSNQAKSIILILMLIVMIGVWLHLRGPKDVKTTLRFAAAPFMAYVLLSPTFHPWYAIMLLALLPFILPAKSEHACQWFLALPWLYLSGALIFSYLAYNNAPTFRLHPWIRLLEWVPTWIFLLYALTLKAQRAWWQRRVSSAERPLSTSQPAAESLPSSSAP